MTEALIEIRDLVVSQRKFQLQIPEWTLAPGTVAGIVGPNGAGKTTLLRLLPGLDRRDSGELTVIGMDPGRQPGQVRRFVGFMSDDMPIYKLRVDKLFWTLSAYWDTWDASLVDDLVDRFEIDLRKRVDKLSKGEGTRVRLICALAFQPRLLVLDEPATGLDIRGRRRLLETVIEVVQDSSRSVVISSHQLSDLERIADELLVLDQGKVVRQGRMDDLVSEEQTLEEALLIWDETS